MCLLLLYFARVPKVDQIALLFSLTAEPLYNTVRYNTVLDIIQLKAGSQMVKTPFPMKNMHYTLATTQFG